MSHRNTCTDRPFWIPLHGLAVVDSIDVQEDNPCVLVAWLAPYQRDGFLLLWEFDISKAPGSMQRVSVHPA